MDIVTSASAWSREAFTIKEGFEMQVETQKNAKYMYESHNNQLWWRSAYFLG